MRTAVNRAHHIEGEFHLYDSLQGGRTRPVESGYRPQHRVHDNYASSGRHVYPQVEQLAPGATAKVQVWFVTPEVHPASLWIGRELDVMEGARVVGKLTVSKILNDVLAGTAETYTSLWTKPVSSKTTAPESYLTIFIICSMYMFVAGITLVWGIEVYTPCVPNFEGGCSMGKELLALGTLDTAALAACLTLGVKSVLASTARTAPHASTAGGILGGLPLIYILFTIKSLFFG